MKRFVYIYIICVALSAFSACSSDKQGGGGRKAVTAKVQSAPYELLVVANKDWLKTTTGQSLVEVVEAPIEGLPQVEPHFRVTYIDPVAFKGTFRTYGNIVMVRVGKKYGEPLIWVERDVYAQPQLLLHVDAPDNEAFVREVLDNRAAILSLLNANEFSRERAYLNKKYSGVVNRQAKQQFGVNIHVPQDIDDVKKGAKFFWASASKQEFRLNVCLYTLPMQEMTLQQMVAARDSVMQINIPGGREGQWMETDSRTVSSDIVTFDGKSVVSMRGLWDMKNDAMGGPFVCYVYPDEKNNRLLVAEGFVFAPEENKRALIRQLEAALQTLEMPEK